MRVFDVSDVWKPVLLPRGAQSAEVVAPTPNIDGVRAFLVHFGQILGGCRVDFGQFQALWRGRVGLSGAVLTPQRPKNRFFAIGTTFWPDLENRFSTIFGVF